MVNKNKFKKVTTVLCAAAAVSSSINIGAMPVLAAEEPVSVEMEAVPEDDPESTIQEANTLESEALQEAIISAINNNRSSVDVSAMNVSFDLTNGEHILSDFQDDLFFEYAKDTFCVKNLTFHQENGILKTIDIHYTDSFSDIAAMRAALNARINEIITEASAIEDETEKIGKVSELIWSNYYDDFSEVDTHTNDAYGCLVMEYATDEGAASAFQACMKELGYEGSYWLDRTNSTMYNKTKIGDEWKYTNISLNQGRGKNAFLLINKTESNWDYGKERLTTAEYTPISLFSDNETLNVRSTNGQYFYEQILAGSTSFTLPDPIEVNYKKRTGSYNIRLYHEYPIIAALYKNGVTEIRNGHLMYYGINYKVTDPNKRQEMVKEYNAEVEKIVKRANKLTSDEEKIVFVNNYILKTAEYKEYEDGVYLQNSHNAYGCLIEGNCVCEGYATAFHEIMKRLGIEDQFVQSYDHIWNKVTLNGETKIVDVTYNSGFAKYLLSDMHRSTDDGSDNGSRKDSLNKYVFRPSMSMCSDATLSLVEEIGKGTTHIDTSDLSFYLDSESKDYDVNYYIKALKNIYPVETLNVDTMTFNTDGDKITSVDVTYIERTASEKSSFDAIVNPIITEARSASTEAEKVAIVMKKIRGLSIKKSSNEDVLLACINKGGSYIATTRLSGYILEKLGIRYNIIFDRNNYPHLKTVYDGNVKWSCPVLGYAYSNSYTNEDKMSDYSLQKDDPVFDFFNSDNENAYIDGDSITIIEEDPEEPVQPTVDGVTLDIPRPTYGDTITAIITPADADVTYQWYNSNGKINGATGQSYTPTEEDVMKHLRVYVKGTGDYEGEVTARTTAPVQRAVITGVSLNIPRPIYGDTITAVTVPADANATYQWYNSDGKIEGATEKTYTPTASDVMKHLRVYVKGSGAYTGNVTVRTTAPVQRCQITGVSLDIPRPTYGDTITAVTVPEDANATYQWYNSDGIIEGATEKTYTPTKEDVMKHLRVYVKGSGAYTGNVTVRTTAPVQRCQITEVSLDIPRPTYGDTITAVTVPADTDATYQWYNSDGKIEGATGKSYTPTKNDIMKHLRVYVKGSGAYTSSVTVRTTAPVQR